MSSEAFLKYLVKEMVTYMDMPKEEIKKKKEEKKQQRMPFLMRWFGLIPLSVRLFAQQQQHRFRKKEN
ncbi:YqzE family protein [Mechercharimyces sp. CAU 1602]|uniref:YqzE family protein n=1 Tax=Mechercharimyces sp. CAU 1602 TaxID=2973933 RepID=UPI002163006C|nr:YqzE family protein [Mechercharimyces sp. CAU 1602]MCS1350551.1 YqzE family protein [Mechercharimyces sp. CAU 1602]